MDRTEDVDARQHGTEVIGRPTHNGEDTARRERHAAAVTIEPHGGDGMTEPDAVLDAFCLPRQFDVCERTRCGMVRRRIAQVGWHDGVAP